MKTVVSGMAVGLLLSACATQKPQTALIEPAALEGSSPHYHLSDAHLHLTDFLQETDGAKAVVEAMDRAGVDHAMVTGMPFVKKWSKDEPEKPRYYLDDDSMVYWYSATDVLVQHEISKLPESARHRLHPFISGFNVTDRNAIDHIKRMVEWYPDFWEGIGEVMAHHDDLTALTPGETARPDNISLDPVLDFAAEHDLPVSVHTNIGSVWQREPIYLHEVEAMLDKHPRTRVIWCHAGISRRIVIPTLVPELRRVLHKYPNLSIDVSWVVYDDYLAPHGKPDPAWVALVKEFPNRFMIGSDIVGHFTNLRDILWRYSAFLDALPPAVAQRLARDNFIDILPKRVRARIQSAH